MVSKLIYLDFFPPHHLIDYPDVALDDLDDLGADVFVCVVRNRESVKAVPAEFYGSVYGLEKALFIYAGYNEVTFVYGFGSFSRGTDADGGERMPYAGEERAFLRECTAVANHCKRIHLKTGSKSLPELP